MRSRLFICDNKLFVISLLVINIIFPTYICGCPCGCDVANSLLLDNYQRQKYALQFVHELNPVVLNDNKVKITSDSINSIQSLNLMMLTRGVWDLNFFANMSVKRNNQGLRHHNSFGDPVIGVQTLVLDSENIYLPFVYFSFGLKYPLSNSYLDKDSNYDPIEVHGNGLLEFRPRVDLSWNYNNWGLLISDTYVIRNDLGRDQNIFPGNINKLRIQGSYAFWGKGQIWSAFEYELRGSDKYKKNEIYFDKVVIYRAECAVNLKLGLKNSISLSYNFMFPFLYSSSYIKSYDQISLSYHFSV